MKHLISIVGVMLIAASLHAAEPVTDAEPAVITSPAAANPATPVGRDAPRRQEVAVAPPPAATAAPVTAATGAPAQPDPAQQPSPRDASADRIELGATQITGNAELPRVMYVVPWKRAELGELAGKPARSLLDEVLAPVDRDVFRRQNRYYDALQPDDTQ